MSAEYLFKSIRTSSFVCCDVNLQAEISKSDVKYEADDTVDSSLDVNDSAEEADLINELATSHW